MYRRIFFLSVVVALLSMGAGCSSPPPPTTTSFGPPFRLTSPAFQNNKAIPSTFTCDGKNISPALDIHNIPEGTLSLALIVDDPDAPRGTWVHWTLWNISTTTTRIAEGALPPQAIEGITSFGTPGYGGPCPPSGTHHYRFTLYALRSTFAPDTTTVLRTIDPTIVIAQSVLTGTYERQQ